MAVQPFFNPIVEKLEIEDYPIVTDVTNGVKFAFGKKGTGGLPKTEQVTSQVNYDDGFYQKGNSSSPRFINNGDNTITDKATGLMWIKQPELIIPDGLNVNNIGVARGLWVSATTYNAGDIVTDVADNSAWFCLITNSDVAADFLTERLANPSNWSATKSVWAVDDGSGNLLPTRMIWDYTNGDPNALDLGLHASPGLTKSGHSDWKLPNIKELMSLVNYEIYSPAIDSVFTNCHSDYYWSSTVYASIVSFAWSVSFEYGDVIGIGRDYYSFYFVRPVRQC